MKMFNNCVQFSILNTQHFQTYFYDNTQHYIYVIFFFFFKFMFLDYSFKSFT